jgi:hypothetical protein
MPAPPPKAKPAPTPKPRVAAKPKPKATAKPKPKAATKPKPKAATKPVRIARLTAGSAPRGGRGAGSTQNRYDVADEADYDDSGDDYYGGGGGSASIGALDHIAVEAGGPAHDRVGVYVDGGADYTIQRRGARELVLTLYDTRASNLNVRRVLDARSLRGRVRRVLPTVEEDRERVVLTIELREASRVKVKQSDGMLWLDFVDPGAAR